MTQKTDEELMQLYQQGNEKAFEMLYLRHSGRVMAFIQARLKNPSQASEVFQNVFLKLHRARARFDASLPFLPWLFTITKTVLIDYQRQEGRAQAQALELDLSGALGNAETHVLLREGLTQLGDHQRQSLEMRYLQGRSFAQIAAHLNTSPANVRQMIGRGLKRLKTVLHIKKNSP